MNQIIRNSWIVPGDMEFYKMVKIPIDLECDHMAETYNQLKERRKNS